MLLVGLSEGDRRLEVEEEAEEADVDNNEDGEDDGDVHDAEEGELPVGLTEATVAAANSSSRTRPDFRFFLSLTPMVGDDDFFSII